jgi:hypothetical protein
MRVLFVLAVATACSRTAVGTANDANAVIVPVPAADVASELLRGRDVGGPRVGFTAQPSLFFRVGRLVLPSLNVASLERLADADDPTLRAFGLWGLTLAGRPEPVLRHVCDRAVVTVFPGGCTGSPTSLGDLAQQLLREPSYLGDPIGDGVSTDALVPAATIAKWVSGCEKRAE